MTYREIIDKIIRLLKMNYEKYNGDSFEKGIERETIKDLLEDALDKYLLDSGKGVVKKQEYITLDSKKEFESPDNIQQLSDVFYIDDDDKEYPIEIVDIRRVIDLYGEEWRTRTDLPEYAIALDDFDETVDYRAGTEITSPENNAIDISALPTIEWEERDWRKYFTIEISTSEDFDTTVVDDTSTTTSYEVGTQLDFDTTYYVRVKAIDSQGNGVYSDIVEFKTETGIASSSLSLLEKSDGLSLNNFRQFGVVKDSNGDMRFYYSGYTGSTNVCYIMTGKNFANMTEYVSENSAGYRTALHTESLANSSDDAEMCNLFYSEEDGQMYAIVSAAPTYSNVEVWKISMPSSSTGDISITQKSTNDISGFSGVGIYYTGLQYLGNNILYDPENNKYYRFRWDDLNNSFSFTDTDETLSGTLSIDFQNCLITETEGIRIPEGSDNDLTVFDIIDRTTNNTQVFYTEDTYDFEIESTANVFLGKWAEFYYDDNGNKILYITMGYDTDDDTVAEKGILYRFLVL